MKKSDHFNGKTFFNPTWPTPQGELFQVFKMLKSPRAPWPRFVENVAKPRLLEKLAPGEVALTFVNHATFLIQVDGLNILTDPVWSHRTSPVSWAGPARVRKPGIEFEALPRIDLILLSHNHYDHLDSTTLKKLAQKFDPTIYIAQGDARWVEPLGFSHVQEFDWWQSEKFNQDVHVTYAPTQHFSSRTPFDRNRSLWGSFMIQTPHRKIYFGGDAGYSSHYVDIQHRLGSPDIALLGIGAYEPNWFMKPMHMNPAEAVQAHLDLQARLSVAMHFGTFQLSAEAIDQPVKDLMQALEERQMDPGQFIVMNEGETRLESFK